MWDTENDLRAALQSVVPDELEVSGFRARLDRLIAEQDEPVDETDTSVGTDAVPAPLDLTEQRRQRSGRLAIWVVTAAACAAAVAGIVIAVLPDGSTHPRPIGQSTVPADVRPSFLPGTIVLETVTGSGPRTFDVIRRSVPKNFEYSMFVSCSGGGKLAVSGGIGRFGVPECTRGQVAGYARDGNPDGRSIVVKTDPGTTWRVIVVLQPKPRTNAAIQSPVDDDMTGPDSGVRQSGTGTTTVRFSGAVQELQPKKIGYRVRLVCNGSGVSMPGLKAPDVDGLTTKTCFTGREYVWQDVSLTLPATVKVIAAAGTTWTIVVN